MVFVKHNYGLPSSYINNLYFNITLKPQAPKQPLDVAQHQLKTMTFFRLDNELLCFMVTKMASLVNYSVGV